MFICSCMLLGFHIKYKICRNLKDKMVFVSIYDNAVILLFQTADDLGKVIPVDIPQHNATSTVTTATVAPTPTLNSLSGTTFFSAGLALFIRVVMGIYFLKSVLNFGHGLKYKGEKSFLIHGICHSVRDSAKSNSKLHFYCRLLMQSWK